MVYVVDNNVEEEDHNENKNRQQGRSPGRFLSSVSEKVNFSKYGAAKKAVKFGDIALGIVTSFLMMSFVAAMPSISFVTVAIAVGAQFAFTYLRQKVQLKLAKKINEGKFEEKTADEREENLTISDGENLETNEPSSDKKMIDEEKSLRFKRQRLSESDEDKDRTMLLISTWKSMAMGYAAAVPLAVALAIVTAPFALSGAATFAVAIALSIPIAKIVSNIANKVFIPKKMHKYDVAGLLDYDPEKDPTLKLKEGETQNAEQQTQRDNSEESRDTLSTSANRENERSQFQRGGNDMIGENREQREQRPERLGTQGNQQESGRQGPKVPPRAAGQEPPALPPRTGIILPVAKRRTILPPNPPIPGPRTTAPPRAGQEPPPLPPRPGQGPPTTPPPVLSERERMLGEQRVRTALRNRPLPPIPGEVPPRAEQEAPTPPPRTSSRQTTGGQRSRTALQRPTVSPPPLPRAQVLPDEAQKKPNFKESFRKFNEITAQGRRPTESPPPTPEQEPPAVLSSIPERIFEAESAKRIEEQRAIKALQNRPLPPIPEEEEEQEQDPPQQTTGRQRSRSALQRPTVSPPLPPTAERGFSDILSEERLSEEQRATEALQNRSMPDIAELKLESSPSPTQTTGEQRTRTALQRPTVSPPPPPSSRQTTFGLKSKILGKRTIKVNVPETLVTQPKSAEQKKSRNPMQKLRDSIQNKLKKVQTELKTLKNVVRKTEEKADRNVQSTEERATQDIEKLEQSMQKLEQMVQKSGKEKLPRDIKDVQDAQKNLAQTRLDMQAMQEANIDTDQMEKALNRNTELLSKLVEPPTRAENPPPPSQLGEGHAHRVSSSKDKPRERG